MPLDLFFRYRRGAGLKASHGPPPAALLVLSALALLAGFLLLSHEVAEEEYHRFDAALLQMLRPGDGGAGATEVGPGSDSDPRFREIARDLTALGGGTLVTMVTGISCSIALLAGRRRLAVASAAFVISGSVCMKLLKHAFDRARPDLVAHWVPVDRGSFPSGHTMMATIAYLTLGIMLTRAVPRRPVRVAVAVVALAIPLLVGISRVSLGVHWPTDVLAGWLLGAVWASLFWLALRWVDPDAGGPVGALRRSRVTASRPLRPSGGPEAGSRSGPGSGSGWD